MGNLLTDYHLKSIFREIIKQFIVFTNKSVL
jgi:hypothetical protein